jgi:hypothetical protein
MIYALVTPSRYAETSHIVGDLMLLIIVGYERDRHVTLRSSH